MIDAGIIACRFAFDAAAILLWGSSVYLWLFVERGLRTELWNRLTPIRRLAVAILLVATVLILPLRTAVIVGDVAAAASPDMLFAVVTATNIGLAWSVQMAAGAALALFVSIVPVRHAIAGVPVLSAILLASLSLTGHAAMNTGWLQTVQQINNTMHLLAGGFWIGALPVVLMLVPGLAQAESKRSALEALKRFSSAGHLAVALVILSGVVSATMITGRFPPEPGSTYEVLLLIKIGLVGVMVILALVNRYVIVPRMRLGGAAGRALARGTLAEIVVATIVIGLVAAFGMLPPR